MLRGSKSGNTCCFDDAVKDPADPLTSRIDLPTVYVQYARNLSDVEDTIDRLWLFLITGAFGGSGTTGARR